MADTREHLSLQAQLLRTQMEALALRAQLMQRDHQDLAAQLGQVTAQLQALAAADSAAKAPPVDDATAAELARIATLTADQLPQYVTKQARNDDGTQVIGPDGLPVLVRQDGSPLTVIERAIMARAAELRGQRSG